MKASWHGVDLCLFKWRLMGVGWSHNNGSKFYLLMYRKKIDGTGKVLHVLQTSLGRGFHVVVSKWFYVKQDFIWIPLCLSKWFSLPLSLSDCLLSLNVSRQQPAGCPCFHITKVVYFLNSASDVTWSWIFQHVAFIFCQNDRYTAK